MPDVICIAIPGGEKFCIPLLREERLPPRTPDPDPDPWRDLTGLAGILDLARTLPERLRFRDEILELATRGLEVRAEEIGVELRLEKPRRSTVSLDVEQRATT